MSSDDDKLRTIRVEISGIQGQIDSCQRGSANLDRYRESLLKNVEGIRRWQNGFADPIESMPGGRELADENDAESRKALSELEEQYQQAKSEYAKRQKDSEQKLDAKKRELASALENEEESSSTQE